MTSPADESSPRLEFWANRWANGKIGWHKDQVNEFLERNIDKIVSVSQTTTIDGDNNNTCPNPKLKRVLVPLCGKTIDIKYLADHPGVSEVVGVDGVQTALDEFMKEHKDLNIRAVKDSAADRFEAFSGTKVSLLRGDFFELDAKAAGTFDVVFDRASMVAINPTLRKEYVEVLRKVLAPGGKILLVTIDRQGSDEEAVKKGPPFTIPEATVRELYEGQDWVKSVTLLSSEDSFEKDPSQKERFDGLDRMMEHVFLIESNK